MDNKIQNRGKVEPEATKANTVPVRHSSAASQLPENTQKQTISSDLHQTLPVNNGICSASSASTEDKLRTMYRRLFHEMQFRAAKNALINYHEARRLRDRGHYRDISANIMTVVSASGVLGSLAQRGKAMLSSKAGLAGMIGLPVSGLLQLLNCSSSSVLPSYKEVARKHVTAAAGWNHVAEIARTARLRMLADPEFDLNDAGKLHRELLQKREDISKLVLISKKTLDEFYSDEKDSSEKVFLALRKRAESFDAFQSLEKEHFSKNDVEDADHIYF